MVSVGSAAKDVSLGEMSNVVRQIAVYISGFL